MSEEEIIKEVDKLCSNWKPAPTKIKMKQHVYDEIEKNYKGSRETSLVMTKLEEAQFWAIKGITREGE